DAGVAWPGADAGRGSTGAASGARAGRSVAGGTGHHLRHRWRYPPEQVAGGSGRPAAADHDGAQLRQDGVPAILAARHEPLGTYRAGRRRLERSTSGQSDVDAQVWGSPKASASRRKDRSRRSSLQTVVVTITSSAPDSATLRSISAFTVAGEPTIQRAAWFSMMRRCAGV